MDTIDIKVAGPAPLPEKQQAIEQAFVENAASAGAIDAYIVKKSERWTCIAEFVDTKKAALYAAGLTSATAAVLKMDIKPTSNDPEN